MIMSVEGVLRECLDTLKTDGWTVGITQNPAGQRCAMGAVGKVVLGNSNHLPTPEEEGYALYMGAIRALVAQIPPAERVGVFDAHPVSQVCVYNNARTSFEDEIVPWFEKAITSQQVNA